MQVFFRQIAFFCLFLILNSVLCHSFNVYIPPQTEQCFSERAFIMEKVLITFNVQQGGYQEIDVSLRDSQDKVIYAQEREEKGTIQFKSPTNGLLQVCFSNAFSTLTGKVVSFRVYVGNSITPHESAKEENLAPLDAAIVKTAETVNVLHDTQTYLKYREMRHTRTINSNQSRIVWMNLLKWLIIISVSGVNVYALRSLLEKGSRR